MTTRLSDFLAKCAADVYPEPRSQIHDDLTLAQVVSFAAKLPAGAKILDVGCGQGPALKWFTEHGYQPTGIAIGEDVRVCQAAGLVAVECDQNNLPDDWSATFDAVWARHVAEHSPIPYFTLTEFFRVLKPGGWLYLEMPSPGTCAGHQGNRNHYSVFTPDAWGALLGKAGFIGWDAYLEIPVQLSIGLDLYFAFTCRKPL
jgi:SAM-dependent methyltransferase